jgi:hypothetical protein
MPRLPAQYARSSSISHAEIDRLADSGDKSFVAHKRSARGAAPQGSDAEKAKAVAVQKAWNRKLAAFAKVHFDPKRQRHTLDTLGPAGHPPRGTPSPIYVGQRPR